MTAILNTLTETELALVRETQRENIVEADEDSLVELHGRVRRARNKFVGVYRREASTRVANVGGRGKARPKNLRNAQKAEIFEDALARVSRQLAIAARRSAMQLRAQRLAAARDTRNMAPPAATMPPRGAASRPRATTRPVVGRATAAAAQVARKRQSTSAGLGARRQTRRDQRG